MLPSAAQIHPKPLLMVSAMVSAAAPNGERCLNAPNEPRAKTGHNFRAWCAGSIWMLDAAHLTSLLSNQLNRHVQDAMNVLECCPRIIVEVDKWVPVNSLAAR